MKRYCSSLVALFAERGRLGDEVWAEVLDVNLETVRGHKYRGKFPAAWYPIIFAECSKLSEPVVPDPRAFNFKRPDTLSLFIEQVNRKPQTAAVQPEPVVAAAATVFA